MNTPATIMHDAMVRTTQRAWAAADDALLRALTGEGDPFQRGYDYAAVRATRDAAWSADMSLEVAEEYTSDKWGYEM